MFNAIVPQTVTVVKKQTRPAPEPTLTFTKSQWAAMRNGMLAELLL